MFRAWSMLRSMLLSISPRRLRSAALVVAAVGALSVTESSAQATCYSSTPAGTSFADSPVDGDAALAPEITTVSLALDGACDYAVDPGVTAPLIGGDSVFEYVDVDGNPATGSAVFKGADVAIGSLGLDGPDPAPLLGRWNPALASFSFTGGPSLTPVGNGGFRATLDQLGTVVSPAATTITVGTMWTGIYDNYFDFAPDPPQAPIALPIAFSTVAPPAPAPVVTVLPVAQPAPPAPPVTAPVTTTAPVVTGTSVKSCTVPAVKRLRTTVAQSGLRRAGCKVGLVEHAYSATVAKGRVVTSLPKAGTRKWSEPVDLVVSKGHKPKHHKAHRASVPEASAATILEIAARRLDAAAR
jgi:hypothetical protein